MAAATHCQDPVWKNLCGQYRATIPCCPEIHPGHSPLAPSFPNQRQPTDGALRLFELEKGLSEKGGRRLRVAGLCMFPCLRAGDILHIEPLTAEEIKIGDIAVFRKNDRWFAHRTTGKGQEDGFPYIITRPDNTRAGDDGLRLNGDILGVVSKIERNGKMFSPGKREPGVAPRLFIHTYSLGAHLRRYFFSKMVSLVARFPGGKEYARLTAFLFAPSGGKIELFLSTPLPGALGNHFHKFVSFEEFLAAGGGLQGQTLTAWSCTAKVDSQFAASFSFLQKPSTCPFHGCWVAEANMRIRYRITALGKKILQRVDELLERVGIFQVFVQVSPEANSEEIFFRRWGFQELTGDLKMIPQARAFSSAPLILMAKKAADNHPHE